MVSSLTPLRHVDHEDLERLVSVGGINRLRPNTEVAGQVGVLRIVGCNGRECFVREVVSEELPLQHPSLEELIDGLNKETTQYIRRLV